MTAWRRACALALLALPVAALPVAALPVAALPTGTTAASVRGAATAVTPSVSLTRQSETVVGDGVFSVEVSAAGPDEIAVSNVVEVALTVHQRVKTRSDFVATTTGGRLGSVLGIVAPVAVSRARQDRRANVRLSIHVGKRTASCADCIELGADGVYPVHVELRERGAESVYDAFTTHLIYAKTPNDSRLGVALIVPLHLPPSRTSSGTLKLPPTDTYIGLVEALLNHPLVPATLLPTPETVEALHQSKASGLVDQLRSALSGREVIGSTYVPWRASDMDAPALRTDLSRQRRLGDEILQTILGALPSPGITVLPGALPGRVALDALGTRRLVTTQGALAPSVPAVGPGRPELLDPGALDGVETSAVPLVVLDPQLQAHLTATLSSRPGRTDDILRAQQLLADLAVLHFDAPRRVGGVAVLLPTDTSQTVLDLLLSGVGADVPTFVARTLSELFDLPLRTTSDGSPLVRRALPLSDVAASPGTAASTRPPAAAVLPPASTGSPTSSDTTRIVRTRGQIDAYRSLFRAATAADELLSDQLWRSLSADLTATRRLAYLRAATADVQRRLAAVRLAKPQRLTLTARRQDVPIVVLNDTGRAIRVELDVTSDNVALAGASPIPGQPSQRTVQHVIDIPGRLTQQRIAVETRGPGSFSMIVRLRSTGGLDLSIERYTLRSTIIGGLGKILTLGALIFLALWWSRSIISARRKKAAVKHPAKTSREAPPT